METEENKSPSLVPAELVSSFVIVGAPVYLAAVMKYLAAEILEPAGNAANNNNKSRTIPRHLQLVILNDVEFSKLMADYIYPSPNPSLGWGSTLHPGRVAA